MLVNNYFLYLEPGTQNEQSSQPHQVYADNDSTRPRMAEVDENSTSNERHQSYDEAENQFDETDVQLLAFHCVSVISLPLRHSQYPLGSTGEDLFVLTVVVG